MASATPVDAPGDSHGPAPPLLRLLALSTQALARLLHNRLEEAGFDDQRPSDDTAFAHIPPEGIRLTELARRAGVTKQAMAEVVASLEGRGYLERSLDPSDARAKLIRFSERGWASVAVALDALQSIEAELVENLGRPQVADLRRTLSTILDRHGA